jgi:protein arginine kinase
VTIGELIPVLPAWFNGEGQDRDVVISTRIRLARNLANRRFPQKASLLERSQAFKDITEAFANSSRYGNFECVNCSGLTGVERLFLAEQKIISSELIDFEGDRGLIADMQQRICVMVNEQDHIRFQCLDSGCCPEKSWSDIDGIDDDIGGCLEFAYDKRRGFLTSSPVDSGAGLRASFVLHLPALILTRNIDQTLLAVSQMGMVAQSFFGEPSNVCGGFFQFSGIPAIGSTESEFLNNVRKVVEKTVECERTARQRILNDAVQELSDKIHRAYGILTHATMMDEVEFINLSSAIRMGMECNLFNPLTIPDLNRLTLLVMPAHLQMFHKRNMNSSELSIIRAETVKKFFATSA